MSKKEIQYFNIDFCCRKFTGSITRENGDIIEAEINDPELTYKLKDGKWKPTDPNPDLQDKICRETF